MMVKLILRGLRANRMRMALTAIAVVLGVAFVSGTLIFSATLNASVDDAFAELGKGTDTLVRATSTVDDELGEQTSERPVPASVRDAVAKVGGVRKAHGEVSGFAAVVDAKGKVVGDAPQLGRDWPADDDLTLMRLTSGRSPRTADEIAIDRNTFNDSGHRIGDRVTVALPGGSRPFTLTGVFRFGESELAGSAAITAFEPAAAQRLLMERPGTYTQIVVQAEGGVSQQQVRDAVAAVLPAGYEAVTGRQVIAEASATIDEALEVLGKILLAFAFIAVFVGSFIIFNTFAMLVAQRGREMALLRAVGASRAQVTRAVLGEAAAVGLIGSTLGIALGGLLARLLGVLMSALIGEELPLGGLTIPRSAVIVGYLVGVTGTLASAYLPARRAARIPPVAAMREETALPVRSLRLRAVIGGVSAGGGAAALALSFTRSGDAALSFAGGGAAAFFLGVTVLSPILSRSLIGVLGLPFARLLGTTGRLSRQNAQRNPRRTAATASALMIGLAVVGAISVIIQSMLTSVDRQLEAGLVADYQVVGRSAMTPVGPQVAKTVSGVPGVRGAVEIRTARLKLNGKVHDATAGPGPQLSGHYRLRLEEGTPVIRADELLVNRATATAEGLRAGGTVKGEYQDGTKATLRIAGVYADVYGFFPAVPSMIMSPESLRAHYGGPRIDRLELTVGPDAEPDAIRAALAPWPNLDLKDREQVKKDASGDIGAFLKMTLALLALSILIAAMGIVNTLALSVVERTREIGLLRAVGMQRRQVRRMIRYEAVLISVFGVLLGLGVGVVFGIAVRHAMADEGVDVLAIPFTQLALYVLAGAVIGVLAAVWPAHRAARTDILRAITAP